MSTSENFYILLAEDSNDQARILVSVLQRTGYEIKRVENGFEAFEEIKKRKPDLLITDVTMPRMSGFELLHRLNQDSILPPTIVLTGKQREEDVIKGLGYGALDYITKPFNPTVLIARVKAAIQKATAA